MTEPKDSTKNGIKFWRGKKFPDAGECQEARKTTGKGSRELLSVSRSVPFNKLVPEICEEPPVSRSLGEDDASPLSGNKKPLKASKSVFNTAQGADHENLLKRHLRDLIPKFLLNPKKSSSMSDIVSHSEHPSGSSNPHLRNGAAALKKRIKPPSTTFDQEEVRSIPPNDGNLGLSPDSDDYQAIIDFLCNPTRAPVPTNTGIDIVKGSKK